MILGHVWTCVPLCDFSNQLIPLIEEAYHQPGTEQWYWEQVVVDHIKELDFSMNCQPADQVYEFENLEELRLFDPKYQNHSDNAAMQLVAHVFNVKEEAIHNIRCLKSGMTNQSFLFELDGKHYICRIPGPGTEFLINRKERRRLFTRRSHRLALPNIFCILTEKPATRSPSIMRALGMQMQRIRRRWPPAWRCCGSCIIPA